MSSCPWCRNSMRAGKRSWGRAPRASCASEAGSAATATATPYSLANRPKWRPAQKPPPWRTEKLFVADESDNALTYLRDVFLPVVPKLYARWEAELGQRPASFLRVGSWIGGDRDGNPFVTAETLQMATGRNAAAVLGHYLEAVHAIGAELSVSSALAPVPAAVEALRSEEHTAELQSP